MSYIHRYSTYSVLLFRVLTVAVACSMTDVITYKLLSSLLFDIKWKLFSIFKLCLNMFSCHLLSFLVALCLIRGYF
jgi:hypothetical protein